MTKNEFINNVKVGSKIKDKKNTWCCVDIVAGFMYDFRNEDKTSDVPVFAMIGFTDASLSDYELVEA